MSKKVALFCFIVLIVNTSLKAQRRILYVIDSVAYYDNLFYVDYNERKKAFLYDDEIASSKLIADSVEIKKLGYHSDTLVFIITKEFLKRPLEYKLMQNIKNLIFYETLLYNKSFTAPYTGSFIEYNINGTIERTGFIKNGVIEGIVKKYDNKGRVLTESEFKGGVETSSIIEYWPNGNVFRKYERHPDFDLASFYTSDGKLIMEYTYDSDYNIHYSKSLKKEYKEFKHLIPKSLFRNEDNYTLFLKDFKKNTSLFNPKSFETYFFLGITLMYYGEFENAIHMLDTAIYLEPSYYDSRICRLYCLIFKYEFENFQTINNFKAFDKKSLDLIKRDSTDLLKICQDINELKDQGFKHQCEYIYEDVQGNEFPFKINLPAAEKKYCKK